MTAKLHELAERCEQAAGPDRDLNADIIRETLELVDWITIPDFTASLDDAMTLVVDPEKGVSVWRTPRDGGLCCATVHHGEIAEAKTMPLALCAAALRAKATSND